MLFFVAWWVSLGRRRHSVERSRRDGDSSYRCRYLMRFWPWDRIFQLTYVCIKLVMSVRLLNNHVRQQTISLCLQHRGHVVLLLGPCHIKSCQVLRHRNLNLREELLHTEAIFVSEIKRCLGSLTVLCTWTVFRAVYRHTVVHHPGLID